MRRGDVIILASGIVLAAIVLRPVLSQSVQSADEASAEAPVIELMTWVDEADLSKLAAFADTNEPLWKQDRSEPSRTRGARAAGRGRAGRLTEEKIELCLEIAREVRPELAEKLETLRGEEPEAFDRAIHSTARGLLSLAEMKQRSPELYELKIVELRNDIQVHQVAKQLRDAIDASDETLADTLERDLRFKVLTQMSLHLKTKFDMLCRFEDRVAAMRFQFEEETEQFEQRLDQRVEELKNLKLEDPSSAAADEAATETRGLG